MFGVKLTKKQKGLVHLQKYSDEAAFYCEVDVDGSWVLSLDQILYAEKEEFAWLRGLPIVPLEVVKEDPLNLY